MRSTDGKIGESSVGQAGPDAAIVLSDADRELLRFKAGRGLLRALAAQAILGLAAGLVSWLVAGAAAGASALIGAGAYFIPNALFAMRLLMGLLGSKQASPFTFFLGELIKLGSAVLLLALAAYLAGSWLVWPALLFGLVCVLKGYVLLLVFRRLP
ncbi:ATP synthase subunit I [Pusillimonas sp.]|uniref:ATP synthase subunit I n=1 Tax=Pusillimonas sp. TaxID=3040095 RepID=UPI0037CBF218